MDNTEKILQLMHEKDMSYNEAQKYLLDQEHKNKLDELEADEAMWNYQNSNDPIQSQEDFIEAELDRLNGYVDY